MCVVDLDCEMTLASGEHDVSWILANTGEGAPVAVGLSWIGSQSHVTNCNLESRGYGGRL